jgi:hypothetical protein
MTTGVSGSQGESLDGVLALLSRVADDLLRIDAEPECQLLRDPESLVGVSEQLALDVADAFSRIWVDYQRAQALVAAARRADASAAAATAELTAVVHRLDVDVRAILHAAEAVGAAWSTLQPIVQELQARLGTVERQAEHLEGGASASDAQQLALARRFVDHLATQAARDPLSIDPQPARGAVERIETRVEELLALHDELPGRLVAAEARLDRLRVRVREGREELAAVRELVADPEGLLSPVALDGIEVGELGLSPWLERLRVEARAGRWLPAAKGLDHWEQVASAWEERAEEVWCANHAPVKKRNELRGLLDAYRAKAGATGQAEDPALADAFQAARDALYRAPCAIEEGERLVQQYGALVSGRA